MINDKDDDQIDLTKLFGTLLDHKWLIIFLTFFGGALGVGYALLATPIYTANASIQVEEKGSGSIFKDFANIFEHKSSASTEISVMKSRMVLEKSVAELNLTTKVTPVYSIPFISKGLAHLSGSNLEAQLSVYEPVSDELDNAILEIGPNKNEYRLFSKNDELVLEGVVNRKYVNDLLSIQVSILKGDIGQRFEITKIDELSAIQALQNDLNISEKGKQTGVVEISLNGENQREIKRIVKSVSENYILQNIARNSEDASKSLDFLQNRLPEVREKLAVSENSLNEYRQQNGSIDLSLEAKSFLDTVVQLEADLNALTIKESELSQKFTKRHPTYIALLEQRKILLAEKDRLAKQMGELPDTQKEIVRLTRDLEVDQQIYIQLLNKVQELGVVKAGVVGNVRILDVAQVLPKPVAPKKAIIVALAVILSAILGIAIVFVRALFHRGIESADELEKIGLSTYATIPYSSMQDNISIDKLHKTRAKIQLLSEKNPADLAIEALRSLRTSLHFAMLEASNNIVMFSGASPSVGKSFVAANFANIVAKTGQKVLLIDMDLRRSYMHHLADVKKTPGVVDVLVKGFPFEQVVQSTKYASFDLIVRGDTPPNPSEVLASKRCKELLEWASKSYDLVVIDTPPILAVADAAIVGRYVSTTFLIGRFEDTTLREVELSKAQFEKSGVPIKGFILNGMKKKSSNRYDYYQYSYK